MIELYTWTTPNGEKPVIMLEECGLDYELKLVDISSGEQKKSDFLAINPNGRIPALLDDGQRVFEFGAILIHLAERTGRLLAASGSDRAEALGWTFFQAGGTGPMLGQWNHFNAAAPEKLPYAIERYRDESLRLLGVLESRLENRDFLAGGYSIADVMNYSWAKIGLDRLASAETFPALATWVQRVGERPAVKRGLERLQAAKGARGMRFLFLGDMVGRSGRTAVFDRLPGFVADWRLDFVVVNGENAAGGFGITEEIFEATLGAGADVVTTGNHVFDQREALDFATRQDRFLRPANYPSGAPGRGSGLFEAKNGARILVANVMGRVFMHPDLDDPFRCAADLVGACPLGEQADAIIVDFHAEATSEKQCFAHYLDGRASVVVGTHTHVPTADHQILAGGTAYQSDAGMCGDYDSSLGMEKEEPLNRFVTKVPRGRFDAAQGPATICGLAVEISDRTGLAEKVAAVRVGPRLQEIVPDFW